MKIIIALSLSLLLFTKIATAQTVSRNDIVIDEIMADPSPQVGLPNTEWIELKNTSSDNINLSGWRIMKAISQSGAFPNYILKPDSFVIICTASAIPAMSVFGPAISVTNFPSLNNTGDIIYISSNENKIMNAVDYTDAWYKDESKKSGGWTLEMIDTKNPCGGILNWKASTDNKGGTPGKVNSADAVNPDETPPKFLRAFAPDSISLSLIFDEPLDSLKASSIKDYSISNGIGSPVTATAVLPLFDEVNLKLAVPLQRNKVYTITINGVADCGGIEVSSYNTAKVGLRSVADSFDIVINEILFNPLADGVDYVELYNRSANIIDLKQLYIANRSASGAIGSLRQLTTESILIFPGDFIVVTEDPSVVQQQYLTTNPNAFVKVPAMPSFPDDKGDVIILNAQGKIIDEVMYSDKWHFELITTTEGVALERIDYNAPSVQSNFHSASTSVGYGTPGYKNSQFRVDAQLPGRVVISPSIFSPDNDGTDDFANIIYSFPTPGYVANITIFNASGRPVRYLQRNALCGTSGNFLWDGLDEKHEKLSQGIYILFTEVFNTSGRKKQFKNTIVLARKN